MSGPGNWQGYGQGQGHNPNQPGQAYSQAIPLPNPPAPVGPGFVPGAPPPTPPPGSNTGRNVVIAIVAVAAMVALGLAVFVMFGDQDGGKSGKNAATTTAAAGAVPQFRINDCLYDVPQSPQVGNCDDGGSPYKVVQIMPVGQKCRSTQTSILGERYCLAVNLNVNYCYSAPVQGGWMSAAAQCGAPQTITVISVVSGVRDSGRCTGVWKQAYYFEDPVFTVCANLYT